MTDKAGIPTVFTGLKRNSDGDDSTLMLPNDKGDYIVKADKIDETSYIVFYTTLEESIEGKSPSKYHFGPFVLSGANFSKTKLSSRQETVFTSDNFNYTIGSFDRGIYLKIDDTNCSNMTQNVLIAFQNHEGYQELIFDNTKAIRERGIKWFAISKAKDTCGQI